MIQTQKKGCNVYWQGQVNSNGHTWSCPRIPGVVKFYENLLARMINLESQGPEIGPPEQAQRQLEGMAKALAIC